MNATGSQKNKSTRFTPVEDQQIDEVKSNNYVKQTFI